MHIRIIDHAIMPLFEYVTTDVHVLVFEFLLFNKKQIYVFLNQIS